MGTPQGSLRPPEQPLTPRSAWTDTAPPEPWGPWRLRLWGSCRLTVLSLQVGPGRALQVQVQPPRGPARRRWQVVDPEEDRPLLPASQPPEPEGLLQVTGVAVPSTGREIKWEDISSPAPPPAPDVQESKPGVALGVCWGCGWPSLLFLIPHSGSPGTPGHLPCHRPQTWAFQGSCG